MKQKKIIVPILTLAVMLLMVGGVYAVFSSTQPEKSKAENVRDTTDQDYEKGLTEEQKAFNELGCVSKVSRDWQLCKPNKASRQIYHSQKTPCKFFETHSHSAIILDFHKEALYQVALPVVEIITLPRI